MQVRDLVATVSRPDRRRPVPDGQFQFDIDRATRKILGSLNVFAERETVRVQTGQTVTWSGDFDLPDSSSGGTRSVRCRVRLECKIERNEAAARDILQAMLDAQFDFDGLARRLVIEGINRQFERVGGHTIAAMENSSRRQDLLNAMRELFRKENVPVQLAEILPIDRGEGDVVDLADLPGTLRIRVLPSLDSAVIGYKARLVWGREPQQRMGRMFYTGTYAGQAPGPQLADPLVPDQIQPLEAWFRVLLAEALGQFGWGDISSGNLGTLTTIARTVSAKLGRGTGRVVDTLQIVPAATAGTGPDRTIAWEVRYAVSGIPGRALTIEHTLSYTLKDRDRWEAQGSPDPERVLRPATEEATRKFLVGKSFNDMIELYFSGESGQRRLNNEISAAVGAHADRIGSRLVSTSLLLSIPEKEFVQGRRLRFQPLPYSLAQANLAPTMKLALDVAVGSEEGDRRNFARAQVAGDRFSDQVGEAALEAARASLRRVSALDYYASQFVNGPPETVFETEDALSRRLQTDIESVLRPRFGLLVTRVDLEPGADLLIDRMKALTRRSILFDETLSLQRGNAASEMTLHALGTVFVVAVDPDYWSSFYNVAQRIATEQEHIDAIREMALETLRMLHGDVAQPSPGGVGSIDFKQMVVQRFSERMSMQFGLRALLSPLTIRVQRPGSGDTSGIVLPALRAELETVVQQLNLLQQASTYDDVSDRRQAIMERIRQIREDIREEEKLQEQTIAQTETFSRSDVLRINQDRVTGQLTDES